MLSESYTITKRQLGVLMILASVGGLAALFGLDVLRLAQAEGISAVFRPATLDYLTSPAILGPLQRVTAMSFVVIAFVGATLIPLGGRPA